MLLGRRRGRTRVSRASDLVEGLLKRRSTLRSGWSSRPPKLNLTVSSTLTWPRRSTPYRSCCCGVCWKGWASLCPYCARGRRGVGKLISAGASTWREWGRSGRPLMALFRAVLFLRRPKCPDVGPGAGLGQARRVTPLCVFPSSRPSTLTM